MHEFYIIQIDIIINKNFSHINIATDIRSQVMEHGCIMRSWETIRRMLADNEGSVPDFRGHGQDMEVFDNLARICLQSILPRKKWLSNYDKKPISEFVTVADEALAYLVLENNYMDWMKIATNEVQDNKKRKRETKYTLMNAGGSSRGSKKGWSVEGKERYNDYFDSITEARMRDSVKAMEVDLLNTWKEEENSTVGSQDMDETVIVTEKRFTPRSAFDYSKITFEKV